MSPHRQACCLLGEYGQRVWYNDWDALDPPLRFLGTFSLLYLIKGDLCHFPQTVKSTHAQLDACLKIQDLKSHCYCLAHMLEFGKKPETDIRSILYGRTGMERQKYHHRL